MGGCGLVAARAGRDGRGCGIGGGGEPARCGCGDAAAAATRSSGRRLRAGAAAAAAGVRGMVRPAARRAPARPSARAAGFADAAGSRRRRRLRAARRARSAAHGGAAHRERCGRRRGIATAGCGAVREPPNGRRRVSAPLRLRAATSRLLTSDGIALRRASAIASASRRRRDVRSATSGADLRRDRAMLARSVGGRDLRVLHAERRDAGARDRQRSNRAITRSSAIVHALCSIFTGRARPRPGGRSRHPTRVSRSSQLRAQPVAQHAQFARRDSCCIACARVIDFPIYLFIFIVFLNRYVFGFYLTLVQRQEARRDDRRATSRRSRSSCRSSTKGRSIYDTIIEPRRSSTTRSDKLEVIVVDDCSTDDSYEWACKAARELLATSACSRNPVNMGKRKGINARRARVARRDHRLGRLRRDRVPDRAARAGRAVHHARDRRGRRPRPRLEPERELAHAAADDQVLLRPGAPEEPRARARLR